MRIARCLLLTEPPSIDANEITDKGYLNQRAVLARRAALVERLHADPGGCRCYRDTCCLRSECGARMKDVSRAQSMTYEDVWLLGGARTPFADYNGTLREVSATDLGIKAAREALRATDTAPESIDAVIAASVAQTSFDAFFLPRHVGIYAGVPIEVPALLVQRLCTSGFEAILQAADQLALGKAETVLCVGTKSMSRNPIASYSHRGGFKMGQVEFKDFLWEATLDTAPRSRMGDTAEELAKRYQITREDTDDMAKASFDRALQARRSGYFEGEIVPVVAESFEREGYQPRGIRLPRNVEKLAEDEHPRPTSREALAGLKPAFKGVQTGGNSSAIVDGAAGVVVGRRARARATAPGRWRASLPARRSVCRRRSWGSVRCRPSARFWTRRV